MTITLFAYTDQLGRYHESSCGDDSLEACLDILAAIVGQGYQLNKIYLIDQDRQIEWPVEAFDGTLMNTGISSLQHQWKRILG